MARLNDLPFQRGTTYYNGSTPVSATDSGTQLEGKEYLVEDGPNQNNTGMYVRLRVVRNVSGVSLTGGGYLVQLKNGTKGQVIGYPTTQPSPCFPIDDQYPAAAIINNDLFYVVTEGPCKVWVSVQAGVENSIAVDDWLVNSSAAASTASTTAGRAADIVLTGSTATLAGMLINSWGRAISAATTSQTTVQLLSYVQPFRY